MTTQNEFRTNVFVYGSLRKGLHNHRFLLSPTTVSLGTSKAHGFNMYPIGDQYGDVSTHSDRVKRIDTQWPYCVDGDGTMVVEGYSVDAHTFAQLDHLEGYPSNYDRKEITVDLDGVPTKGWVYFANLGQGIRLIPEGDWVKFKAQ